MALQAPEGSGAAPTADLKKVVQDRAEQFYMLLQTRQFTRAEAYVTSESRERLRDQASNPFLGFRILSVDVNADGKSATVAVELTVMVPHMGGLSPFQRTTHWRLEDQEWRIEVPEPPPVGSLQGMMALRPEELPKPEELKFKGHSFGLGVMKPGEHKEARFPFTNETDHVVTIAQITTGCDCLKVKTQQMQYQPGESGEFVVEFDSSNYEFEYNQTVVVKTNPGNATSYLRIHGQVVPREIAFPPSKARDSETK